MKRNGVPIRPMGRRGLTLVELSIGLLVTSMVVTALGGLWFAVAQAWRQSSTAQATALAGAQAAARMERTVRESRFLVQYRPGSLSATDSNTSAQLLIWKRDDWNNVSDGAVQVGELTLLEHDPKEQRLYFYEPIPAAQMSLDQQTRAGRKASWSDLAASNACGDFKSCDFVRKQIFCEAVEGALLNVPSWGRSARPALEYKLRLARGTDRTVVYGTASLRGPTTRPH